MPIAMGLGYVGGVLLTYFFGRWIVSAFGARIAFVEPKRNLPGLLGAVGGLLALLPGLFLGTVVGGNLGGAYGEAMSKAAGLGMLGVPIGLAVGVAIVTTFVACAGVLLGAAVGKVFNVLGWITSAT